MKYIWSKYNLELASCEDGVTVFNTQSGAICELEQLVYQTYSVSNCINEQMPYFEDLLDIGFITQGIHEAVSNEIKVLKIVLSCTESCNLRCYYCFEENHPKTTFFENQKPAQFMHLLNTLLDQQGFDELHITWFGGEPLLYFKELRALSVQIIEACKMLGVEYSASIVTNATMLSPEVCDAFEKCKINRVQITVDGECGKFVENKKGSVDQWGVIINSLPGVIAKTNLTLRFNMDKNNICSIKDLLRHLSELNIIERCKIVFARIGTENPLFKENVLSWPDYFNNKLELISYLINELRVDNDTLFNELTPLENSCALLLPNALVVDSQGYCHKCEDRIGYIESENLSNIDLCVKKAGVNAFSMRKSCEKCKIYHLCKGECQAKWDYTFCNEKIEYIKKLAILKIGR